MAIDLTQPGIRVIVTEDNTYNVTDKDATLVTVTRDDFIKRYPTVDPILLDSVPFIFVKIIDHKSKPNEVGHIYAVDRAYFIPDPEFIPITLIEDRPTQVNRWKNLEI